MTSTRELINDPKKLRKAFVSAIYQTLDGVLSPTPYLEVTEGENVDVRFLDGRARLPTPNSTEVNVLDLEIGSLFFDDFNLLFEGNTGVGKTYTSDALFDTVFGPESHRTLRLSGGVLGNSALEPFTRTVLEGGVPKTHIDHAKCAQYGALFIDEINRGDTQEVFQVVDGVVNINGDRGYLRVPIPGTNRHKKLAIIAAMNPADTQHSAAVELDIAAENRFLKFPFPNGVAEAGSGQLEKRVAEGLHDRFWTEFRKQTGRTGSWRENYPIITDPTQLPDVLEGDAREFIDVALGYVGYDPRETVARNNELAKQVGIDTKLVVPDNNDYKKILATQANLKHGFVRRDLRKIRDLARLLGFVKGVKNGTYDTAVNLNDVAAGMGVILEGKTATRTAYGGLMTLVNDARVAYLDTRRQMNAPDNFGIRQAVLDAAMHVGVEKGWDAYLDTLKKAGSQLGVQVAKPAQATIRSRLMADIGVLQHFSQANKDDVKNLLKESAEKAYEKFGKLYDSKKSKGSIYEHRLSSIIG